MRLFLAVLPLGDFVQFALQTTIFFLLGRGRAPFGSDLELFKLGKGGRRLLAHLFARDLGLLIVAGSSSLGIDFSFHRAQTDGSRHVSPYQKMLNSGSPFFHCIYFFS